MTRSGRFARGGYRTGARNLRHIRVIVQRTSKRPSTAASPQVAQIRSVRMTEAIAQAEESRSRPQQPLRGRELAASALVGISFLCAAGLLADRGLSGSVDTLDVVLFVLA